MSSFEQRLISEIEYRLERSPVEESDDDVEHDENSAGRGVAPSFDQKLKHYKVFEGMPVTFSCKIKGDPKPKVRGSTSNLENINTLKHSWDDSYVILKHLLRFKFLAWGGSWYVMVLMESVYTVHLLYTGIRRGSLREYTLGLTGWLALCVLIRLCWQV